MSLKSLEQQKTLQKLLKQEGVNYQVAEHTRDLGTNFTFSKKLCMRGAIATQRLKTATKGPLKKMCQLVKLFRVARVLFSGAVFSKSTWGFQPAGMSFAYWVKIEVAAANAAGYNQGRCRYSALCIAYGEQGHPFARAIRERFVLWFKLIIPLVKTKDKFLDERAVAWQLIKDEKITLKDSLNKVQGVLSHVSHHISVLLWVGRCQI